MNTYLVELIELCKAEELKLESAIQECIRERDFKVAHYLQKALDRMNAKLNLLYHLQDPKFYDKVRLKRTKEMYTRSVFEFKNGEMMKGYFLSKVAEAESKLNELNKLPYPEHLDNQEIDNTLYLLIEGKISRFKLYISVLNNWYLEFSLSEKSIIIVFTPFKQIPGWIPYKTILSGFEAIGFKYSADREYLFYQFKFNNFKSAVPVKTILARVFFDVFQATGTSHMEIIE